ncbi:unnamed protein product [Brugia timori]|uniref:Uncharacterized protein n=1 Tax=Brugia timori TaxID=42155 RepID=A0A0R3R1U1_9BILA|nr:unnamed protein product [Brugia timori]
MSGDLILCRFGIDGIEALNKKRKYDVARIKKEKKKRKREEVVSLHKFYKTVHSSSLLQQSSYRNS